MGGTTQGRGGAEAEGAGDGAEVLTCPRSFGRFIRCVCGPRLSASQHARHDALRFVAELGKLLIRQQIFPSHLGQLEQRVGAAQPVECQRDLLVAVLYQLEDAQIALMARVLALGDEHQFFQDAVAQALKRNRLQRAEPSPICFGDARRHGLFVMPAGGIDKWVPKYMGSDPDNASQ